MVEEKLYLEEKDGGAPFYLLRRVGHAYTRVAGIAAGISVNTGIETVTNDTHDDQFVMTWIWEGRGSHTEKGETKQALVLGVDENCGLIINENGTERILRSGEVRITKYEKE